MTQLTMKAGLKWWKEKGEDTVSKELGQLHWHDMFELVDPKMMTRDDFSSALESHLFLKEKHNGTLKGCMVTGRNKQCGYIKPKNASSPTAALESVLLTVTINAQEGQDIAIINVPNAFVQMQLVDKDDMAIMCLRG